MSTARLPTFNAENGEELIVALQEAAVRQGISDIHFNPEKDGVHVAWRELGVLQPVLTIPSATFETIVRRIKFNSKLRMNVTNIPQDGQYTFSVDGRVVNVRVATLPSRCGEAFTLRFLDPAKGIVPLEQLGFPEDIKKQLIDICDLPNGLLLVTGPTGSGKTTTLYALLSRLAGHENNIITLEDPIEYELANIVQSQVDPDHGFTFASGLRSILRHDPDIILVGEIRDAETAQTAIDAALTGHLVLATLHTNSAIEAIPRLLSMGVSTYTCAPALRGILAQRLVRTINPSYRKSGEHQESEPDFFTGRCTLPELLVISDALRNRIINQSTSAEILETARQEGYKTMAESGAKLVASGVTTQSEIDRVTAA